MELAVHASFSRQRAQLGIKELIYMRALPLKTLAVTLAAGLALAACATATPYQPAGFNGQRGGYAEQRLENNRFRVSFSGNSVTSRDQVEMSLLLRSAELTV